MLNLRKVLLLLSSQQRLISVQSKCFYSNDNNHEKPADGADQHKQQAESAQTPSEDSAAARLNKLLASMQTDNTGVEKTNELSMAKPGGEMRKRREEMKAEKANKDIIVAAKRVAELLDGDRNNKKSEMELLSRLLNHQSTTDASENSSEIEDENKQEQSLKELMVSMKIVQENNQEEGTGKRSEFVRRSMQRQSLRDGNKSRQFTLSDGGVNLFDGESWGVFKNIDELRDVPDICGTWEMLSERELKMLVTHAPRNYFEKLARWTEEGKVWHFPIDNEQGLDEERDVDFTEHIFLEQHLESWCPNKGPIRHFMELVCVGLSKNPYISAKEKKAHILWYRDYFEEKKELLKDLMQATTPSKQNKQLGV